MIDRVWVQRGQRWYHPKTGGYYETVGIAEQSTNGRPAEEFVVYWSEKHVGLRARLVSEFLDGRFIPCHRYGKTIQFIGEDRDGS